MRRVAFAGVVVSTAALVAAVVAVPLLYAHLQRLQAAVDGELAFCRVSPLPLLLSS